MVLAEPVSYTHLLESLEKRVPAFAKKAAQGDKEAKAAASVLGQALDLLRDGKPARLTDPKDADEERILRQAQLLTSKPVLYVCNVCLLYTSRCV